MAVLREQGVTDGRLDLHPAAQCKGADFALEGVRSEIIGGRIHQVAGEVGRLCQTSDLCGIGTLGRHDLRQFTRFAVAIEAIGAESEAQGRQCRIADRPLEPIAAGTELRSGQTGDERRTPGGTAHAEGKS